MAGRVSNSRTSEDAAVGSSVVAFLVAGVLFMASVVAVLVTTTNSADEEATSDAPDVAAYRIQADALADLFITSPGYVANAAVDLDPSSKEDWSDGANSVGKVAAADNLARLGLLDAQSTTKQMLDFAKFQNLRAAPFASNPTDQFVNYEEARRTLGLEQSGLDFHIRAYPSLQSVADLLACQTVSCRDPNLLVSYVGDIEPPSAAAPPTAAQIDLGSVTLACSVSPLPKAYRVTSTVVNKGSTETQIRGVFDIRFSDGPRYTKTVNSPVLQPHPAAGSSITFTLDVPAYNGRVCGTGTDMELELYDSNDKLLAVVDEVSAAEAVSGAVASAKDLWVESATYLIAGSPMKVTFDGSAQGNGFKNQPFTFVLYEGEGTSGLIRHIAFPSSTANGKGGDIALPAGLGAGVYTAVLYDGAFTGATDTSKAANALASSALRVSARVNVVLTAPGPYTPSGGASAGSTEYTPGAVVETEVFFLETLVQKFCPTYQDNKLEAPIPPASWVQSPAGEAWDPELDATDIWVDSDWTTRCAFKTATPPLGQPGDVFPDRKNILRDELVPRLICDERVAAGGLGPGLGCGAASLHVNDGEPRYDLTRVLVIGSNVDHNELAPAEIKYALEDWTKGGGTLIVLGSIDQSVNWLMPILKTGIKSSSGAVSFPDAAHPILHVPDELDYVNYANANQVWDFRGSHEADDLFTQIVAQGDGTAFEPILAVSNPGAIQNEETGTSGTVILTTWLAGDVFLGADESRRVTEGQKFLNNLLMMGYGDLYMDYGPPIPEGANAIPAIRFAQIKHPDFEDPIQLSLNVFVFG